MCTFDQCNLFVYSVEKDTMLCFFLLSDKLDFVVLYLCLLPSTQAKLAKINERMRNEYTLRRKMLLKRLDVTVQSFRWSDRAKVSLDSLHHNFSISQRKICQYKVMGQRSDDSTKVMGYSLTS